MKKVDASIRLLKLHVDISLLFSLETEEQKLQVLIDLF